MLRVGPGAGGRRRSEACIRANRPSRVDPARVRQDHGELVTTGPARDIGRTDALAQERRDLGEQPVPFDLPDPGVRQLEVVDVQHADRQPPAVSMCPRDLERKRLVEQLSVAETGQPVSARELAKGAPRPSALDRRPGVACDCLERLKFRSRHRRVIASAEHGQEAEMAGPGFDRYRDGRPQDRPVVVAGRVVVREPDGAHTAAVRRAAHGCGGVGSRPAVAVSRAPSRSIPTSAPATPGSETAASAHRASTSSRSSA